MADRDQQNKVCVASKIIRRPGRLGKTGNIVDRMVDTILQEANAADEPSSPDEVDAEPQQLAESTDAQQSHADSDDAVDEKCAIIRPGDLDFTLIHLNDDCLCEILNNLQFYYLNKVASTCTRLQFIARTLFAQLYNDDRLTYKKIKIMFYDDEIRNFGALAEKMWLGGSANSLRLMVEANCGETLRRLIFSHMHKINFGGVAGVEELFKPLTELSFFRCSTLEQLPLAHCTELTKLEFCGKFFDEHVLSVYPKLTYFRCEYDSMEPSIMRDFLLKHMQLKEIIAHSYNVAMVALPELEKLVIRQFTMDKNARLQPLDKLKVLELGICRDGENNAVRVHRFLSTVPNADVLVELRLPRFRSCEAIDHHDSRSLWTSISARDNHALSMDNLVRRIGQFANLRILKMDMHEFPDRRLRHLHSLQELRHLKLKDTRAIGTDELINWIGHLKQLETLSIYNGGETTLMLDASEQIDGRLRQMYRIRPQTLTINYFMRPHNAAIVTEDYSEDVYELCPQQMPYHKYKTIVLNAKPGM